MTALFKQIFKAFLKNGFLVFGLLILLSAALFISTTSIQLVSVLNSSLNGLNQSGNNADVTSKAVQNFGKLAFSYELDPVDDTKKIIKSSLEIQGGANPTWQKNRIYPYEFSDFYDANDAPRTRGKMGTGITYNAQTKTIDINENDPNGFWNSNYGTLISSPLLPPAKITDAISYGFLDENNNILLDPQKLIYTNYGSALFDWNNGAITRNVAVLETFARPNFTNLKNDTNMDPALAFGRCEEAITTSMHKGTWPFPLKPKTLKVSKYSTHALKNYALSIYTHAVPANTYSFKINFDQSRGPIKQLLTTMPDFLTKAFNESFADMMSDELVQNGAVDFLQLENNEILLNLDDQYFADANVDIDTKKQETFKNFSDFLSNTLTSSIEKLFFDAYADILADKSIASTQAQESFYKDGDLEMLFVLKNKDSINNVVVKEGLGLGSDEGLQFLDNLKSKAGNFASRTAILTFIDYIQNASFSHDQNGDMDFYLACLQRYGDDLRNLLKPLKSEIIPTKITESPQMKRFALLFRGISFRTDGFKNITGFNFNSGQGNFSFVYTSAEASSIALDNVGVVINTAHAEQANKKYLPMQISASHEQQWLNILADLKDSDQRKTEFSEWLIANPDLQLLTWTLAKQIFKQNQDLFDIWIAQLPNEYTMNYQDNQYIIIGTGDAPDFAFPVISPTSPIPNPKLQVVVYINQGIFNSLNFNSESVNKHYGFKAYNQSVSQAVKQINDTNVRLLGADVVKALPTLENEDLGTVWLRTFFPIETFIGISVVAITACVILILLSFVVIFLLFKALTQNIMPSLAICMANGTSFTKIFVASMLNVGILTTLSTGIGYLIGYLTQTSFLGILNPIWFLPQVLIGFNPYLFVGEILLSFVVLSGIFFFILRNKFKRPIPEILANKENLRSNLLLRHNTTKISSITKLSYGLTSTKIGRFLLLTALFSVALGTTVSTIVINDKFLYSQSITNDVNDFNYGFDLATPNEFAGVYKTQSYEKLGFTDPTKGISSIYDSGRYPYAATDLKTYKLNDTNDGLVTIDNQYLGNFLLPSYQAYNDLNDGDLNFLFDTTASLFLLDCEFDLFIQKIQIWEAIKSKFPNWVVYQLETHLEAFKAAIFEKYKEYYSQFLLTDSFTIDQTSKELTFDNITKEDEGMYQAKFSRRTGLFTRTYTSAPTFLWVDDDKQVYKPPYSGDYPYHRVEASANQPLSFEAQNYKNGSTTVTPNPGETITWTKYKVKPELAFDSDKIVSGNIFDTSSIKFTNEFLKFVGLVFADEEIAPLDSKISFGIVPLQPQDEKYTKVNATITSLKARSNGPSIGRGISILGVQENSKYINLVDAKNNSLYYHLDANQKRNNDFRIIINNGASYKHGLRVGDSFTVNIDNDAKNNSIKVMNSLISLEKDLTPKYTFTVAAITDDSYGEKFYLDAQTANVVTGLNDLKTTLEYTNNSVQRTDQMEQPFNGVFTNDSDPALLFKGMSFYSNYGFWNQSNGIEPFSNVGIDLVLDMYVSRDEKLLKSVAQTIKQTEPSFDVNQSGDNLRIAIIDYLKTIYVDTAVINEKVAFALDNAGNNTSTKMINSQALIDDLFNSMSSLSTSLIITSVSVLAPVLVLVSLVCMLSLINDYLKLIGLLKVLGFSQRNIILLIASIFLPVLVLTIGLGIGFVFATTYGLQFAIYSLTSIYISPGVSASAFFIGFGVIVGLVILCILFMKFMMRHSKLQNVIKF